MTTSLAQQLLQLQVPQTSLEIGKKKRASLLFDPKEAANISKEIFFELGLDGFEELKNKNPQFAIFESTLFHISSKDFERTLKTASENETLDSIIRKFFYHLSPYFLLSCSHKALEWLIYRYYIHQFNKEDFLMLILPYHETNIFVRALQTMKFKEGEKFAWLKPLQSTGVQLPKSTLYGHAASQQYFLNFVSTNIINAVKEVQKPSTLTVMFNFYCTVFTGALDVCDNIQETHISQMIPAITKGLKSEIPDFCASSYIILSKMLTNVTLSEKILDSVVQRLTNCNVSTLNNESVLALVILYQSQEEYTTMPIAAIKKWTQKVWVPKTLQRLSDQGYLIQPLLLALFNGSIPLAMEEVSTDSCRTFVDNLMNELKLDDSIAQQVFNILLDSYDTETMYEPENKVWMSKLLETIDKQNPCAFDKEISNLMAKSDGNTSKQLALKLIMNSMEGKNGGLDFEKLYHPSAEIRKMAINSMVKKFDQLKDRQREAIQDSLLDRLQDIDSSVVNETLKIQGLSEIIGEQQFIKILISVLTKKYAEVNSELISTALGLLCKYNPDENVQVFLTILAFFLPMTTEDVKYLQILKTNLTKSKCFKPLLQQLKNDSNPENISNTVHKYLSENKLNIDCGKLLETMQSVNLERAIHKYLAMLVLSNSMDEAKAEDNYKVLQIFFSYFNGLKVKTSKKILNCAFNDKLPLDGFLLCLNKLMIKTEKISKISLLDFYTESDDNKFVILLLEFLLMGAFHPAQSKAYETSFKLFLNHFCVDSNEKTGLLLNLSTADSKLLNNSTKLRSLKCVSVILTNSKLDLNSLIALDKVTVPYLLVGLQNEFPEIRNQVFDILETFLTCKKENYHDLITGLINRKEEIFTDNEQLPFAVNIILNEKKKVKILDALLNICGGVYPIYLKSGMVKALSSFEEIKVYDQIAKIGIDILDGSDWNSQNCKIISESIKQFGEVLAKRIDAKSVSWEYIQKVLKNDKMCLIHDDEEFDEIPPTIMLMKRINKEVFENLKDEVKKTLLAIIIDMSTHSSNTSLPSAAGKLFKHIDLDAVLVLDILQKMRDAQSPKMNEAKLKRRVNITPTIDILDTSVWKYGITMLEFIQDKKKMRNADKLIPVLFDILKKCLEFEEQASLEYTKQLVLSTILHYCHKLNVSDVPKSVFNMELVVQCIRASQNPQTHHHALLLLAHTAKFLPDHVLQHTIAIFTFMGSSVLRHDDSYSFQIINKTIETVIPILTAEGTDADYLNVLRVFAGAFMDVPEHRRFPLYKAFLEQIGLKDKLHVFLLLICEHIVKFAHNKDKKSPRLENATNLCLLFPLEVIFHACCEILNYIKNIPELKDEAVSEKNVHLIPIDHLSEKEFRHYRYTALQFVSGLLVNPRLVSMVASVEGESLLELEPIFKQSIVYVLSIIQKTTQISTEHPYNMLTKYWKFTLHLLYDVLDGINALLTVDMFLLVIKGLITHSFFNVRKRALELLNSKLTHSPEYFAECKDDDMCAMLGPIVGIFKILQEENLDSEQEMSVQLALISIKLFARYLCETKTENFETILDLVTDIIKSNDSPNILACALLCYGDLCTHLKAKAITTLERSMNVIIKVIMLHKNNPPGTPPSMLLLSTMTALSKIMETLYLFLNPYIERLLFALTSIGGTWAVHDTDPKVIQLYAKLTIIKKKMSSIPMRSLISGVESCFLLLVANDKLEGVGMLMEILSDGLQIISNSEMKSVVSELTEFFLTALAYREVVRPDVIFFDVEGSVLDALMQLVLKMSESSFRPIFYQIFDWACHDSEDTERIITFYRMAYKIADNLKGLFALFVGHFLQNAATLLDACHSKKSSLYYNEENKVIRLVENILETINSVCIYDFRHFMRVRFDIMCQPLVDQLENEIGDMNGRCTEVVIPAIVNFTVAVADEALWKQLIYQILLKMRNPKPQIRSISLICLRDIVKKLGEEFLPLLPETIPFLAELLEDEEESVEKLCQKVVQEMEVVLGEPIQKYF
ncbi:PREDICTED: HEAT repeat-containing protein 1 [Nicrophorus vespilloides]|uniref:HEAT repeat-containing protein 1 n=1 Tax=Nicrophorus vespilloides TaxID=110193 RepID=A0ABM1MJV9_NICVS|nr:PREDICTED: HEAT repeat-containing protein 1 [Nicrophorus vespilloides]